jgi:DNA-binding MarR family transcriptional regulator
MSNRCRMVLSNSSWIGLGMQGIYNMTERTDIEALPSANVSLAKTDYERLAELRRLLRRFLAFSERVAQAAGLTAQQHQALLMIKGFPGRDEVLMGELADCLGIGRASAAGVVDRLAAKNLLTRRSGPVDRRQVLIGLTPAAEMRLARLSMSHQTELARQAPLLQMLLTELSGKDIGNGGAPVSSAPEGRADNAASTGALVNLDRRHDQHAGPHR